MATRPVARWRIVTYQLLEAADAAWHLVIVSTYFAVFVQHVLHKRGADYGWALTVGSLLIAVVAPMLGAAVDMSGRRQPLLRCLVCGAVVCTAMLGTARGVPLALALFVSAYVCVGGALHCYTAMLPAVTQARPVGPLVGTGVAIGYAGALLTLIGVTALVPTEDQVARVFVPMAVLYGLLTLPAMTLAPDLPRQAAGLRLVHAYRRVADTVRTAQRHPELGKFLVAYLLCATVVAAVLGFMGLFARNVVGLSAPELQTLFAPGIVVGAVAALTLFGPLTQRCGPKPIMLVALGVWLLFFLALLTVRHKGLFQLLVGPLVGLGLASTTVASRTWLSALAPVAQSGACWGLFHLADRCGSILGNVTWAVALSCFGESRHGYHMAIAALLVYVCAAALIIRTLSDTRPHTAM